MKPRHKVADILLGFIIAAIFLCAGLFMLIRNLVASGVNSRNNQFTGFDGWFLLLFGIIFLAVSYFSLSPFSPMREFFEGNKRKGKSDKESRKK